MGMQPWSTSVTPREVQTSMVEALLPKTTVYSIWLTQSRKKSYFLHCSVFSLTWYKPSQISEKLKILYKLLIFGKASLASWKTSVRNNENHACQPCTQLSLKIYLNNNLLLITIKYFRIVWSKTILFNFIKQWQHNSLKNSYPCKFIWWDGNI